MPLADPRTEQLSFGAVARREDTTSARSDSLTLQTAVTRRWGIGRRTVGLDYLVERFDTGGDEATTALLIPSLGWQGSRSDNPLWPRHGWRLDLTLRGALAGLLSDLSFVQARAAGKYVQGVGRDQRLIGRLDVGSTWVDGFGELPASLRFFAGGDQSVRGYDYEKLGPRDSGGDVVGGRHLLVASVEYEWMFAGNFGGALFLDAGNAFNGTRLNLAAWRRRGLSLALADRRRAPGPGQRHFRTRFAAAPAHHRGAGPVRRLAGVLRGLLLAVLLVGLAGYVALGSDGAVRALLRGAVALAGDRLEHWRGAWQPAPGTAAAAGRTASGRRAGAGGGHRLAARRRQPVAPPGGAWPHHARRPARDTGR